MRCERCEAKLPKIESGYLSSGLCKRCVLAKELGISIEDTDKVLGRMNDIGDPSKWLTVEEFSERVKTLVDGDRGVEENVTKTYCVYCGSDDTEQSETGNGGELFAAEDIDGSVEYYDELELWECMSCEERFFK